MFRQKRNNQEEQFWKWFEINQNKLHNFENDQEIIFGELSRQLHRVHLSLTFEFSPIRENGKREFIISADGIKEAFPIVERLYSHAPELEKWSIIKFRQRKNPINDIHFGGYKIKVQDVYYQLYNDGLEKVGVIIFFKNYTEDKRNIFAGIGFLILDQILGEYDVEQKVGYIDFQSYTANDFKGSKKIENLSSEIDNYFSTLYN